MPSHLILQFMQPNGLFNCEIYNNIPAPQSSYIAIAYTGSPVAQQRALQVKQAFINQLMGLNAGVSDPQPCPGVSGPEALGTCYAITDNTFAKKMLIIVGDGTTQLAAAINLPPALYNYIVPVLKQGEHFNFPAPVNVANCLWWKNSIDETSIFILNRMGVSSEQQRIFISYRQTDTIPLADQLCDTLSHNGFDVFVDRFSIEPGVNFQSRLYQELRDKAMVLFIESEHYLDSKWVQLEVAFAKKYRLGYHALNFKNAPVIDSIHDDNRTRLKRAHFNFCGLGKKLRKAELDNLVLKIKKLHMQAMFRRRHYMNLNLYVALKHQRCKNVSYHNDMVRAVSDTGQPHTLFSSVRPPMADEYHLADIQAPKSKIIYGPEYVESNRRIVNDWLADKAQINYFHEGELLQLTDKVKNNGTKY